MTRTKHTWWLLYLLGCLLGGPLVCQAGGGPENIFLVVNSTDKDSLTIANHYIQLRQIPSVCVFYLAWPSTQFETDIETYREKVLEPIQEQIRIRRLSTQIDYVVYSSGFPYAIEFSGDAPQGLAGDSYSKASLTGLTHLYEFALAKDVMLRSASANRYAFQTGLGTEYEKSSGFRARYGLDMLGRRVKENGRQYYLSTMLGYTKGNRVNTVPEVLAYLQRSKDADYTRPAGTIYFAKNEDIRSRVRHDHFPAAVELLAAEGVAATVVEGILPVNRPDVMGTTVGSATFDWPGSHSTFLPGAIADNFTSFGGVMNGQHGQTLLADFLRAGAAGASGTVVEPYAIHAKFPHPFMHVHYARGCNLAESFYQSVPCPYQLLIVGDPLCQPWAKPPRVVVRGLDTTKAIQGKVSAIPEIASQSKFAIRYYETYIDGLLISNGLPTMPIAFDSADLADGYHELRVVAVEDSPIETQGHTIVPFVSVNQGRKIGAQISPRSKLFADQPAFVRVFCPDAQEIRLYRGRDLLGKIEATEGDIPLDLDQLGYGTTVLQAIGMPKKGVAVDKTKPDSPGAETVRPPMPVFSLPFKIEISSPFEVAVKP